MQRLKQAVLTILFFCITSVSLYAASQTVATWGRGGGGRPTYSFYNGTSWSAPLLIDNVSSVLTDVPSAYNSDNETTLAVWAIGDESMWYSIYDSISMTWTPSAPIAASTFRAGGGLSPCYNQADGTFVVVWGDFSDSRNPYYSVYDGSWSTPLRIDSMTTSNVALSGISCAYFPPTETVLATWGDTGHSNRPYYSAFDGTTWTPVAPITASMTFSSATIVYSAYDSDNERMLATWVASGSRFPFYSFYDGATWTDPDSITTAQQVQSSKYIYSSYDLAQQQFIATWPSTTGTILYSAFDGMSWSSPTVIPWGGAAVETSVFVSYNPDLLATIATTKGGGGATLPIYATYSGGSWTDFALVNAGPNTSITSILTNINLAPLAPSIEPPTNPTGDQIKNDFGITYELFNSIHWDSSPSIDVAGYNIYRDSIIIGSVNASTFTFDDHNRSKNTSYTYSITAFNGEGIESTAITITIP